jgi:hypothetical protein
VNAEQAIRDGAVYFQIVTWPPKPEDLRLPESTFENGKRYIFAAIPVEESVRTK